MVLEILKFLLFKAEVVAVVVPIFIIMVNLAEAVVLLATKQTQLLVTLRLVPIP